MLCRLDTDSSTCGKHRRNATISHLLFASQEARVSQLRGALGAVIYQEMQARLCDLDAQKVQVLEELNHHEQLQDDVVERLQAELADIDEQVIAPRMIRGTFHWSLSSC